LRTAPRQRVVPRASGLKFPAQQPFQRGAVPMSRTTRAAFALCAAALILIALAAVATAAGVEKTTVTLGATSDTPDPSCPNMPCQAVGSVTGFPASNGPSQNQRLVKTPGTL